MRLRRQLQLWVKTSKKAATKVDTIEEEVSATKKLLGWRGDTGSCEENSADGGGDGKKSMLELARPKDGRE